MFQRLSLLASTFAGHFERILEKEIAKVDLVEYRRRNNVLVPRGLVAPPAIAFYKAVRLALFAEPAVSMSPVQKPRVHTVEVKQSVGGVEDTLASGECPRDFPVAPIHLGRTGRPRSAETRQSGAAGR